MSTSGRNNQSVTANTTTVKESTTGAPFTQGIVKGGKTIRTDGANAHFGNTSPGSRANTDVSMFNSSTPGAFIKNKAVGVFGVDVGQITLNNANTKQIGHAGWNVRTAFTGSIVSFSYTGTPSGYTNGDVVTASSNVSGGNAYATLSTKISFSEGKTISENITLQ